MKIGITEAIITAPGVNSRDELIFRIRVKKEDWNDDIKDSIYYLNNTGNPVSIAMVMFQEEKPEDPLPKLRARLAMIMKEYCEKGGYNEGEEISRIYLKYSVSSRGELTKEQLEMEIDSYKAGILQFS